MRIKKFWGLAAGGVLLALTLVHAVPARADQGFYVIDKAARTGMLMSLSKNPEVVEPATSETASSLVGVLGESATNFQIQPGQASIRTDGVATTLVSTVNGDIKVGDQITISSVVGFGGRLSGSGWVVGTAQGSLGASTSGAVKSSVTDSTGNQHEVYIGSIPVLINVAYFNSSQGTDVPQSSPLPQKLQAAADSVAGRRASQVAVVLAFLLLLTGSAIAGLIAYSAIRNAIQSTGRQPLAKQAITRRMLQACGISVAILVGSILGALVVVRIL